MNSNTEKNGEMPYEKFLAKGPGALTEAELLAVILRTGTKDCPALMLAESAFPCKGRGYGA